MQLGRQAPGARQSLPGKTRRGNRLLTLILEFTGSGFWRRRRRMPVYDPSRATEEAAGPQDPISAARPRVRTPGKHIVLAIILGAVMISASTSVVRQAHYGAAQPARIDAEGRFHAKPEEFLVDLAPDAAGRVAYLRLAATIAVKDRRAIAEIDAMKPELREKMTTLLRALTPEDFADSAGMMRIKNEMIRRVRLVVGDAGVEDVIINDLIIQ